MMKKLRQLLETEYATITTTRQIISMYTDNYNANGLDLKSNDSEGKILLDDYYFARIGNFTNVYGVGGCRAAPGIISLILDRHTVDNRLRMKR